MTGNIKNQSKIENIKPQSKTENTKIDKNKTQL